MALAAARAGAAAIVSVSRDDLATRDKGGIEDFVTAADLASEQAITEVIRRHRPGDAIVAEESGRFAGSTSVCWYVDPLDGTANFVAGTPDYAVCVAAYVAGVPTAAVIYRPADDRWLATTPSGLDGSYVPALLPGRPLSEAVITVSRPHEQSRSEVANRLRSLLSPLVGQERRTGSAAWAMLLITMGEHDAYLSPDIPLWDTAAGHLLVRRAGGLVTTITLDGGMPLSIVGTPAVTAALAEAITARQ